MAQVHNIAAQLSKKATANLNANYAAAAAAAKAAVDTARKSYQLGTIRKSIESLEENTDGSGNSDKNPPDPIVTISKVSGIAVIPGK